MILKTPNISSGSDIYIYIINGGGVVGCGRAKRRPFYALAFYTVFEKECCVTSPPTPLQIPPPQSLIYFGVLVV